MVQKKTRSGPRAGPRNAAALANAIASLATNFASNRFFSPSSRTSTPKATAKATRVASSKTATRTTTTNRQKGKGAMAYQKRPTVQAPGYYTGKFPSAKKVTAPKPFDSSIKVERGSVLTAPITDACYLGHGVAPRTVVTEMYKALVHFMFKKAGIQIANMKDSISRDLMRNGTAGYDRIILDYAFQELSISDSTAVPTPYAPKEARSIYSITGDAETYETMAAYFQTDVETAVVSAVGEEDLLNFINFTVKAARSGTNIEVILSHIPAEQLFLEFDFSSNLKIQNRTKSADGSSSTTQTNVNPVTGKIYHSKKWLNGLDLARNSLVANSVAPGTVTALYTYPSTGIIQADSSVYQHQILQKPPAAWVLGSSKATSVTMQPGEIKYSKISFSCNMKWNTLVAKLWKYFVHSAAQIGNVPARCEFGTAEVLGLESLLYDRTETVNIELGWELNQKYNIKLSQKKTRLLPSIDVA